MKTRMTLLSGLLLLSLHVFAQHPLVGTWEMVSLKAIDFDGKRVSLDTTIARETKVITPTHYMLIAHDVKGDSLVFNRSHAGTVRFEENKYIETPLLASWDSVRSNGNSFDWKIEGDRFIQSGTFTRADGKTAILEELIFVRAKNRQAYPENPSNGTWDQLSSRYTLPNGKKESHTRETATRFDIITPTHWVRLGHRNNKFGSAMIATYSMDENKMYPVIEVASFPINRKDKAELTHRVEGDRLHVFGKVLYENGQSMTWDDVFQKVGTDPEK